MKSKDTILKTAECVAELWGVFIFAWLGRAMWLKSFTVLSIVLWCVAAMGLVAALSGFVKGRGAAAAIPSIGRRRWIGLGVASVVFAALLVAGEATAITIMFGGLLLLYLAVELLRKMLI